MNSKPHSKWSVADLHCDVLCKMQLNPQVDFSHPSLDVTRERLLEGHVYLQTFAIYISQVLGTPRFEHMIRQIELFRQHMISPSGGLKPLLWKEDMEEWKGTVEGHLKGNGMQQLQGSPWALLSLEGVEALEGNPFYAELCYALGIRLIGLTWNYANWAADGIMEQRGGGLTRKGHELVKRCNELGLLLDVSHLSVQGFWEVLKEAARPPIASHSNVFAVCPHPRNLRDEQIRALIARNGRIGLTFVTMFLKEQGTVTAEDLLPHIEHICSIGGERHLMFGSDFDGIERHVQGLEHSGKYPRFAELLLKHYPEELVKGWLGGHALEYLQTNLPSKMSS
ncbi:Zn-dependent dipeptidase [Paenibacillus terrae HPL-003]|uniref:Zn-dependent dipeptidase n=1 Tax=Paenibacillus terrae (strain HPL-003) TaxID=985665 RepID=G7W4Q3_PAETH|nr:dipeptidase [Paenibacillus terrae]AET60453.1 Zn-dependent dipeptidase [Paenibacillus terrae HPL-003]